MGRVEVAVIVSLWVIPISILVNRIVPDPYMDEIFHVPQAQQYCKGNFKSWNPMITTPPGLYYLSLAPVASLFPGMFFVQAVSSFFEVCSTSVLRSVNGLLAVLCSIIIYEIILHLRPVLDDRKATLRAVVLALYPLHWFFTFLYYTDVASLTAVLAMYLACLKKKYQLSALLGTLAVFIRQTNIIWMLFVACTGIINITLAHSRSVKKVDNSHVSVRKISHLTPSSTAMVISNLRKRKSKGNVVKDDKSVLSTSIYSSDQKSGLLDEIHDVLLTSWPMKWDILCSFSPFFLVLVAFVTFVYWNGSVVLGAKEAHAVSPHFAQIMYFSLVSTLAMAPVHLAMGPPKRLLWSFWKNKLLSFFQVLVGEDLFLSVIAYGGEGLYYFVEQFIWLAKSGLIDAKHSRNLQKISAWAEFIGYIGSVSIKFNDLKKIMNEEACLASTIEIAITRGNGYTEEEQKMKKLREKKLMKKLSIVQDLADGLMAVADIRDGKGILSAPLFVASAGLLSAIISTHKNWVSC